MELKNREIEKEVISVQDKIVMVSVVSLKYYSDNPKIHTAEQIDNLAKQIKKVGFNQPIIINDKNEVLVGNGRLEAADKLNIEKIPCIKYCGLTKKQEKQIVLADNKLNESEWNTEILEEWLNELNTTDLDTFFTTGEQTDIFDYQDDTVTTRNSKHKQETVKEHICPKCHNVFKEIRKQSKQ